VAERKAEVVWEGDLMSGSGTITSTGSGAFGDLGVTWKARTEDSGGLTSPEELLAAAHAACFSMALSNGLAQAGHAAERLETSAVCTFGKADGGFAVTKMDLSVRGRVPGLDENGFREAAEGAKDGCPISKALAGNVEMSVTASLEG
jgi:osmotically inducible protein OsmC